MKKVLFALSVFALVRVTAAPLKDLPGSIPLQYERQAAADLIYKGRVLLPDEARSLYESGEIQDLSLLNPDETSVLWKNSMGSVPVDDFKTLGLAPTDDQVEFLSYTEASNGTMAFIAQKKSANGQIKTYQFLLDLKGHNILLRKNMLRKIGYNVPASENIRSLRVKFKGVFAKREFSKEIQRKTFIEPQRWVTAGAETEDEVLTVQDVFVFEGPDDKYYNLARGDMPASVIKGRRLLNALLVPYSLSDAPQSVNLMSWVGGQIFNTQLYMPYEGADAFTTSYEDARWIARRLLKLTRNDWQEIVQGARLPDEVAAVTVEKMISRRNILVETLNLRGEASEMSANLDVSMGSRLQKGKLTGPEWAGYARHFAGTDPDSPLSQEEVMGLVKSRALSAAISNLLSEFNTRYAPKTDLGYKIFDHQLDLAAHQFAEFIATKEVKKTPFGFWSTQFFNTNLIASRDVIAGNYLGTENIVQMADTVGFAVDAGIFYMGEGLPTAVSISGQAKVFFVKTYTHVKPLQSIRSSLKEPFRNIMVPYLKQEARMPLDKLVALESKKNILSPEEMEKQLKEGMDEFNKMFGMGESLIISTSLGPDLSFEVGKGISKDAQVYARIQDKLVGIRRIQIFRKDEKTVQVYMDPATYNVFSLSFGLRAKIPILEIGWDWQNGMTTTYFFDFNIDKDLEANPDFFNHVAAVSAAMNGASYEYLKSQKKPWTVNHDFSDKNRRASFLHWRFLHSNSADVIRVTHPDGKVADYIRRIKGQRNGEDYESLLTDVTNALIKEKFDKSNIRLGGPVASNPADTLLGKSVARQVVVETELTANSIRWDNIFAGVNYTWKGWEIKRPKVDEILNEIEGMFGKDIFKRPNLHDTKEIQFYSIGVDISLYQRALQRIFNLRDEEIHQLFTQYGKNNSMLVGDGNVVQNSPWANAVISDLRALRAAYQKGDRRAVVEKMTEVLEVAESQLDFPGFKIFVGGVQNMFVRGVIRGFRTGSENGNQEVQSQSLGQIGSFEPRGPLQTLQSQMNISGGEFFISWLLNPL